MLKVVKYIYISILISNDLYAYRYGTTDSEALFLLALTMGLMTDPVQAMRDTIHCIMRIIGKSPEGDQTRISAALSDGQSIWAYRYSSDHQSPSLFYGSPDIHAISGHDKSHPHTRVVVYFPILFPPPQLRRG